MHLYIEMPVHMYNSIIDTAVRMDFRKEDFKNYGVNDTGVAFVQILFIFGILFIDIWLLFWLWNNVVTKLISVARPMKSLWYAVGLLIFLIIVGR